MKPRSIHTLVLAAALLLHQASAALSAIDYGHDSYKAVLVRSGKTVDVVLNRDSKRKTPAVITLRGKDRSIGSDAINLAPRYPKQTFRHLKELLGLPYDSPLVETYQKQHLVDVEKDAVRGTVLLVSKEENAEYAVEELVAMQLSDIIKQAEEVAKTRVQDVMITVPGYWNQWQRRAMLDAARLANITRPSLMDEHAAIALNYGMGLQPNGTDKEYHIFYDMGSGNTQVTLAAYGMTEIKDGKYMRKVPQVELVAYAWDRTLGGSLVDYRVREFIELQFKSSHNIWDDIHLNPRAMNKLLRSATKTKEVLSANTETTVSVENLYAEKDLKGKMARSDLEDRCGDLRERVVAPVQRVIELSGLQLKDIKSLLFVGGGVRIPFVQQALKSYVGEDRIAQNLNADEADVFGASFRLAGMSKKFRIKEIKLKEIAANTIEVMYESEPKDGKTKFIKTPLFKKNAPSGVRKAMVFKRTDDFEFVVRYVVSADDNPEEFGEKEIMTVKVTGVKEALKVTDPNLELKDAKVKVTMEIDDNGLFNVIEANAYLDTIDNTPPEAPKEEPKEEAKEDAKAEEKKDDAKADDKKDDAKAEDKKPEEKKEDKKEDKKEEKKPEPKKKQIVNTLAFKVTLSGVPPVDEDTFEAMFTRLEDINKYELKKRQREEAKNSLEELLYKIKEQKEEESYIECTTKEELEKLEDLFDEVYEWYFEGEGHDATLEEYQSRQEHLSRSHFPVIDRRQSFKDIEGSIERCRKSLYDAKEFFAKHDKTPEEERYWDKEEVERVRKDYLQKQFWMDEQEGKHRKRKCYEGLVFTADQMAEKFVSFSMDLAGLTMQAPPKKEEPKEEPKEEEPKAEDGGKEGEAKQDEPKPDETTPEEPKPGDAPTQEEEPKDQGHDEL